MLRDLKKEKLAANLWWPGRTTMWDMTATYSEESREAGKGDSELLSFRRGLVTRVPPICCPFPLPLLGHGAINIFQFNFRRALSGDWSHCTSTVPKSELCWCHCSVKSKCRDAGCSLHEGWGHQLTRAGHWLPGSHLPGQALLHNTCWAFLGRSPDILFSISSTVVSPLSVTSRKPQNDPQTMSSFCLMGLRSEHVSA